MYPILLELGGVPIYAYGTARLVGFALAVWLLVVTAKRLNEPFGHGLVAALALVFGSVAGGRLGFVLVTRDLPWTLERLFSWSGGFVSLTGVLGGGLAVLAVALVGRRPVGGTFDLTAPSLVGALALGNLGCFLAGCCVGAPTDMPWALRFSGEATPLELRGVPVHPAQLYLLLGQAAVLALLFAPPRRFNGELTLRAIAGLLAIKVGLTAAGAGPRFPVLSGLLVVIVAVAAGLLMLLRSRAPRVADPALPPVP